MPRGLPSAMALPRHVSSLYPWHVPWHLPSQITPIPWHVLWQPRRCAVPWHAMGLPWSALECHGTAVAWHGCDRVALPCLVKKWFSCSRGKYACCALQYCTRTVYLVLCCLEIERRAPRFLQSSQVCNALELLWYPLQYVNASQQPS